MMIQNQFKMQFLWHSEENIHIASEHRLNNDTLWRKIGCDPKAKLCLSWFHPYTMLLQLGFCNTLSSVKVPQTTQWIKMIIVYTTYIHTVSRKIQPYRNRYNILNIISLSCMIQDSLTVPKFLFGVIFLTCKLIGQILSVFHYKKTYSVCFPWPPLALRISEWSQREADPNLFQD